jgi:hypothetical protein
VEQKRFEECLVAPWPENDVIIASVLVVSFHILIATLKSAGKRDWPIALV